MSPEVWRRFTASSLFWPVAELPRAEASMGQVMELIARGGSDVA